jgi:3-hydroxyacyl-CoA dehydrogenase/enoyl-CoA hydratase/3-hydroxybutyryl-CoA epimerase
MTEGHEHWRLTSDPDGICWLSIDKAGSGTNTLGRVILAELDEILDQLARNVPRGLIIKSAKASGFIAGADINEFVALSDAEEAAQSAARGQAVFRKLADLRCPTVAVINGFALGGGLELALACDYRVAVVGYERCLGLPEVQLGIHPGFGGTVRAIRLLGPPLGLDLMLSGRALSPAEALEHGLVDAVTDAGRLDETARRHVIDRPKPHRAAWHLRILNWAPLRPWLAKRIEANVRRRARPEHYPAPFAILDLWTRFGGAGDEAYRAEAESIGALLVSPTSKNLVRVYFLRERLKSLAPKSSSISRVHVIGAGVMGGDIAAWCALRGIRVSLQDRAMEFVEPALRRASKLFAKRLRGPGEADAATSRITVDLDGDALADAEVVIEAIVERLDAKRELFKTVENKTPADTILATNTSSIRLEDISEAMTHPERLLGVHFFNPVARLPLVEVIRSAQTDPALLERAMSFVTQIGKLPLPCRSAPGFVVNRILAPYMLEALRCHEEGYALETIDSAAEQFGMPTGPVELADRVGLDIALHVIGILSDTIGGDAPNRLNELVESGRLGAKTGEGFYRFENNRPQKARDFPRPDQDLIDRLILAMVNEAMACFEDDVVDDLDLLDAGVIFGAGFAPFRGGPIHYARQSGVKQIVSRLHVLAERYGSRFTPRPGWANIDGGA